MLVEAPKRRSKYKGTTKRKVKQALKELEAAIRDHNVSIITYCVKYIQNNGNFDEISKMDKIIGEV